MYFERTLSDSLLGNLARPLVAPAIFDFWASHLRKNWAWRRSLARVLSRYSEARDTVSLVLKPNRHFAGFRPGQHVNLTVEVDGVRLTRSYSVTTIPGKDRRLGLTIKAIPGGKVSQFLCNRLAVGDVVELSPAFGEMVLPDAYQGSWLLVAAGSGVTPIISIIRALTADSLQADVDLVYWARTRADLCFLDELQALAEHEPRFRLHPVLTREDEPAAGEYSGRPSAELFAKLIPDIDQRRAYACGPSGFVHSVEQIAGARAAAFMSEAFTAPLLKRESTGTVKVTLARQGAELELPTGVPLLQALEEAGIRPAHGCRMGVCNTCVCGKSSGVTEDLRDGRVQHETQSALKICVNAARTDLTLDL